MADDRVCFSGDAIDAIAAAYRAQHDEEQHAFWAAIKEGDLAEVERLFTPERASRPGIFEWQGIHEAVASEQLDVVKFLCEKGVDITVNEWPSPPAPLMLANETGNEEIIAYLKEQLELSRPTYVTAAAAPDSADAVKPATELSKIDVATAGSSVMAAAALDSADAVKPATELSKVDVAIAGSRCRCCSVQ